MKVLVTIPCLLTGGTEIQTLSLIKALCHAGHNVTAVCYFEHADAMIKKYQDAGAQVKLLSSEGKRPSGLRAIWKFLRKGLKAVVKETRPDIAHVQYMAPGALPIIILRLLGIKKIVATAHTSGDIYSKNGLRAIRLLIRYILHSFQCITENAEKSFFGTSQFYRPDMKLKKRGNHFTIYNSLPDYINIKKKAEETGQEVTLNEQQKTSEKHAVCPLPNASKIITLGVVSRLERIKGVDLVLPAFAKLHKDYPNIRLMIVGDGSLRSEMEKQAQMFGLDSESIIFVGRQPQDKLQDFYDQIDILLMPSRSEGFGLTAIEGMARGCVPVVSNTGGLPEVVREGIDGLIHKKEDVEDMVAKIKSLLDDKRLLEKLSANAIKRAETFSEERYNAQIHAWYNSL